MAYRRPSAPWSPLPALSLAKAPHSGPAKLALANGGLARFRLLHRPIVVIADPALAAHVLHSDRYVRSYHYHTYQSVLGQSLFSSDGLHWARRRRMVLPAFKSEHTPRFNAVMEHCVRGMLDRLGRLAETGEIVDAGAEAERLTLFVIARAIFSKDLKDDQAMRLSSSIRKTLTLLCRRNTSLFRPPFWLPIPSNRAITKVRQDLDDFIGGLIDARGREDQTGHDDILSRLLAARCPETGQPMTREELLEECKTLFVAGYETSAVALTWALYRLAADPKMARIWNQECQRPGDHSFTAAVVTETMRLHPPAYNLGRVCLEDDLAHGHAINRGETVLISIYGIHRNPALWDDPEDFRPQRFLDRPPERGHYLPFGSGKHLCVGAQFAQGELITALSAIGRRFQLSLARPGDPGTRARVTLAPAQPVLIRLTPCTSTS